MCVPYTKHAHSLMTICIIESDIFMDMLISDAKRVLLSCTSWKTPYFDAAIFDGKNCTGVVVLHSSIKCSIFSWIQLWSNLLFYWMSSTPACVGLCVRLSSQDSHWNGIRHTCIWKGLAICSHSNAFRWEESWYICGLVD